MADGFDGSLKFDTGMDTSGFEKGSDKLLSAIQHLSESVNALGRNMQTSFQQVIPLLNNIANVSKGTVGAMSQMNGAAEQQSQAMGTISAQTQTARTSVSALEREVGSLANAMHSVSESADTGFKNGNAVLAFDAKIREMEQRIESAKEKLQAFAATQIPTKEYQQVSDDIAKLETHLADLENKRDRLRDLGADEASQSFKNLVYDISAVKQELKDARYYMQQLENEGNAYQLGGQTAQYAQMKAQVSATEAELEKNRAIIDSEVLAQARLNVEAAKEQVLRAQTSAQREQAIASLQAAQERLNELATRQSNSAPREEHISAWQRFKSVLHGVASSAKSVIGSIAKMSFNGVATGLKGIVAKIRDVSSQAKQATLSSNSLVKALTSVKTMLLSRVKRMFISAIFNGIKEALQSLAKFDAQFNASMTNIKNAASGLGANIAVSLGGLISAIEPVLTKIINAISTVISYINALFGLLGGKKTMTVAKKQTQSYADSLSSAGGAAEELNEQVYGFDELNKRQKETDSGGGGGGGASPSDMFETIDIANSLPDSVEEWFDRIKAAFEAGEWYNLGFIIAEGLDKGMAVVDKWINTKLRPIGVKWAANIAEVLNGLTDGFAWGLMGKTLADGFNAAFDILNTFLTTYNFKNLGQGIARGLNSLVNFVDWNLIGQTFANKLNALIDLLYGFVHNTDWSKIGTSFATMVMSWVNTIKWDTAGKALSDGIKGLLNMMIAALEGIRWQEIGDKVVLFISNVDWSGIVSALSRGIGATFGSIVAFFFGIIHDVIDSVKARVSKDIEEAGGNIIKGLLNGIKNGLKSIGQWVVNNIWNPFKEGICKAFRIGSPSKAMEELGQYVVDGFLNGIKNKWTSVTSFISNSFNSIKTTINNAWNTIKTNTSTAWNNIKTNVVNTVSNMKSNLSSGLENIKSTANTAWNSIQSAASSKWASISSTVTQKWESLKSTLRNTEWSSVGSGICSGIQQGIDAGWSWLSNKVSSLAKNMLNTAKNALGIHSPSKQFAIIGEYIDEGLGEGIDENKPKVLKTVSSLATDVIDGMGEDVPKLQFSADMVVTGLDAVATRLESIAATFMNITNMLTSIGGLNIPGIALGSVIPAQTRISDTGPCKIDVNGFAEFIRDFDEYMADNSMLLKKIIAILQKLNLNIDVEELSRMITTAQRGTSRSYGGA